jgi:hypothetical protein
MGRFAVTQTAPIGDSVSLPTVLPTVFQRATNALPTGVCHTPLIPLVCWKGSEGLEARPFQHPSHGGNKRNIPNSAGGVASSHDALAAVPGRDGARLSPGRNPLNKHLRNRWYIGTEILRGIHE